MNQISRFFQIADLLEKEANKCPFDELKRLEEAATKVGKAWSGSWLGYQSRVYYNNLQEVPPGARFSKEWGLMNSLIIRETLGDWVEYNSDDLISEIKRMAEVIDTTSLMEKAKRIAVDVFEDSQAELLSMLTPICELESDTFLRDLLEKIKKEKVLSFNDCINLFHPKGQQISRDMNAIQAGNEVPPHFSVLAEVGAIKSSYSACEYLNKYTRRVASHMENLSKRELLKGVKKE